ncbi:unnamed protein product, partial [Nesidiocoris tenuis]
RLVPSNIYYSLFNSCLSNLNVQFEDFQGQAELSHIANDLCDTVPTHPLSYQCSLVSKPTSQNGVSDGVSSFIRRCSKLAAPVPAIGPKVVVISTSRPSRRPTFSRAVGPPRPSAPLPSSSFPPTPSLVRCDLESWPASRRRELFRMLFDCLEPILLENLGVMENEVLSRIRLPLRRRRIYNIHRREMSLAVSSRKATNRNHPLRNWMRSSRTVVLLRRN